MTRKTIATALLPAAFLASYGFAAEMATVGGITQPSERRTFAFESAGVVADVLVKDGDAIKTGQVLARQESRMDRKELEVRKIDAESTVEIDSAKKESELRKVQYERKIGDGLAPGDSGFSQQEIEEAKITMEVADLKVIAEEQKKRQAKAVFERQGLKVELMDLVSKIDGIVEKVSVDAGEMADPQKPEGAISVVKNDPLWVEVPLLKTWQVARLSPGQELELRYTIDKPDAWQKAKIIFIAPVADARSGTQSVRLELPNPDKRASGLDLEIKLPAELLNDPTVEKTAANN